MRKHTKKKILTTIACLMSAGLLGGCSLLQGTMYLMQQKKSGGLPSISVTEEAPEILYEDYEAYAPEMNGYPMPGLAPGYASAYPTAEPVDPDWNTEEYSYQEENRWMVTTVSPFSTFAADVDTASYANLRRMLLEGRQVPADAVRIEEMINYFDYSYPSAEGDLPFGVTTQIAPCPWNEETQLLLIGLKAREIPQAQRPASNLVFLLDVSGSMDEYNKLPLVQRAFRLLINSLGEEDTVSIVTYANSDTIVADGASGKEKTLLCDKIEDLQPSGGTNGSQGLIRAYELAEKHFIKGGNNRVILATDGDLNIGMTDEGSLTRLIQEKAKSGVFLSVLGFGEGNISDTNMEAMADHGNGNYSYIDSIGEARKVLIEEAGGTLLTVAKDVKLQVEFNPEKVKGYRLIGYENRKMAAEDFSDDTKDGGEIGSGHTVTVLYEIASADSGFALPEVESKYTKHTAATEIASTPEESQNPYATEWATVHIRYKEPDGEKSSLLDEVIDDGALRQDMDDNLSWAAGVAQTGMILRGSEYAGTTDLDEVRARLRSITGNDPFREEFLYMISRIDS